MNDSYWVLRRDQRNLVHWLYEPSLVKGEFFPWCYQYKGVAIPYNSYASLHGRVRGTDDVVPTCLWCATARNL